MDTVIRNLSIDEKLQLIEDLWDSIPADQKNALAVSPEQESELARRLESFDRDKDAGRLSDEVFPDIRAKL